MAKNHQDQCFGHMDTLQRSNIPRPLYPFPPVSEEARCAEQDISDTLSHLAISGGTNDCAKTPYPAPSTRKIEEPPYDERDIADTTTTSPSPSSTSTITTTTSTTLADETTPPHTHTKSSPSQTTEPPPAPTPFSIRQTFSAYPNLDLFTESLQHHRSYYSLRDLATEVTDTIPEEGGRAVRLQHPAHLLRQRWDERRRRQQKVGFKGMVLVYEYDDGGKDMPMRPERMRFHDDDSRGGEMRNEDLWPRNRFVGRRNWLDEMYYWQAHGDEMRKKKVWFDDVKRVYAWTTLEEAKDLSGREERMREKAMARRGERVRGEERCGLEEG